MEVRVAHDSVSLDNGQRTAARALVAHELDHVDLSCCSRVVDTDRTPEIAVHRIAAGQTQIAQCD
ncbi:hypothetical protein D3C83_130190 [compost metagenome]